MGVEIDITYDGDLHCLAVHGPSAQTLRTDAPVDNGGKGEAFSPTDLLATSLGACLVTVMGLLARRLALDIAGTRVHVVKEMTADPVRRVGRLGVTITMPAGCTLTHADRARLEHTANTCPVKHSLHPDTVVDLRFVYPE
ncbi:MAG TPA: OsmC family protein [Thermoanaerobaculaceae bacterium]|nr:OsmC family protein [Thermoanaerobaculaceae bacterium]HPS78580.1 OsmC family protein [Thermoanaerobaculaceae bacterium]